MIVVDTEYTCWKDSLLTGWADSSRPREIVQIAAIRLDDDLREVEAMQVFARPSINPGLSQFFTELTGITQERIDAEGVPFVDALDRFLAFAGMEPIVCMNSDGAVMAECAARAGIQIDLPRFHRLRPFLEACGIDVGGLSSGDLHMLTPTPLEGRAHDALHDVRSMATWLANARHEGLYHGPWELPSELPRTDPRIADAAAGRR